MNKIRNRLTLSVVGISIFCLLFLGSGSTDCYICDGSGRTDCAVCVNGKTTFIEVVFFSKYCQVPSSNRTTALPSLVVAICCANERQNNKRSGVVRLIILY